MSRWIALASVVPLSALLAAIPPHRPAPVPKPKLVVVKAVDVSATVYKWSPADVSVAPGDTLRFEQTTTTPHNVEIKNAPAGANLDAVKVGPFLTNVGQTYDLVIDARFPPGKYAFACTPHELMGMKGTITVAPAK